MLYQVRDALLQTLKTLKGKFSWRQQLYINIMYELFHWDGSKHHIVKHYDTPYTSIRVTVPRRMMGYRLTAFPIEYLLHCHKTYLKAGHRRYEEAARWFRNVTKNDIRHLKEKFKVPNNISLAQVTCVPSFFKSGEEITIHDVRNMRNEPLEVISSSYMDLMEVYNKWKEWRLELKKKEIGRVLEKEFPEMQTDWLTGLISQLI